MELEKFVEELKTVFEDADPEAIKPEVNLRDIEGYSSLVALSIIALVDEKFHVNLNGDDIRNSNTIGDLYNLIVSKK